MIVTIKEHDESVSIFYDGEWKLTLGCEEKYVRYVHDTLIKWARNWAAGRMAPSPVWQLILGGIVDWYSDTPGDEVSPPYLSVAGAPDSDEEEGNG